MDGQHMVTPMAAAFCVRDNGELRISAPW